MTINNPVLEKVFLALRTNFIPNHPKEHITLRYYKSIRWDVLLADAKRLDKKLPATIVHKGIHSWVSGRERFTGLHVSAPDSTILDHLSMPHITVSTKILNKVKMEDVPSHEVIDTLWLGKKQGDNYLWTKVSSAPIGIEGNEDGQLDWSATGLI